MIKNLLLELLNHLLVLILDDVRDIFVLLLVLLLVLILAIQGQKRLSLLLQAFNVGLELFFFDYVLPVHFFQLPQPALA